MTKNLEIDDHLIAEAQKLGRHRTKKEAITAALNEYILRRKQLEVLALFGKIEYDESYDYKRKRRSKRPLQELLESRPERSCIPPAHPIK